MSLGIYGSSTLTLDTKGRIVIPARYRELLRKTCEGEMAITKDPQYPALIIYPGKLWKEISQKFEALGGCLLYTSPSPRDLSTARMPSSA